jgi:hypothetical protein
MRQGMLAVAAGLTALALWPALAQGEIRAGAAVVDATWHVGASAGQYASDGTFARHAAGRSLGHRRATEGGGVGLRRRRLRPRRLGQPQRRALGGGRPERSG